MKKQLNPTNKKRDPKSFVWEYNKDFQAIVLRILDINGMYPLYVKDPEAGMYKIVKTSNGNLHMSK